MELERRKNQIEDKTNIKNEVYLFTDPIFMGTNLTCPD